MSANPDFETQQKIKPNYALQEPPLYRVIYINDEVTTMEFVVDSLCEYFNYNPDTASNITTDIHQHGSAIVAVLQRFRDTVPRFFAPRGRLAALVVSAFGQQHLGGHGHGQRQDRVFCVPGAGPLRTRLGRQRGGCQGLGHLSHERLGI